MISRIVLFLTMLLVSLTPLRAVETSADDSLPPLPSVSLVTVFPGSEIYELEGHTALRITDGHSDMAVNFGLFDFNSPNFVWRFVKGETDYMVGAYPWPYFVAGYAGSGRRIVQQPIELDREQTRILLAALAAQLTPPANTYRYNYVLDNCATRPFDFIEKALVPDSLVPAAPAPELAGCDTFRKVMAWYHRNYPWYQFGIDLALGPLIDLPISRQAQLFAPVSLMQALEGSPHVGEAQEIVHGNPDGSAAAGPTAWLFSPMAVALAVFIASVAVSVWDYRRRRLSRGFDAVLYGIFGLLGLLLAFLVFVSEHYATSPNYLIWWLNPLCLIPCIFIWSKRTKKVVFCYQILNFAVLIGLIIAWPFCVQSANPAFWPLIAADLVRAGSYVVNYKRLKK
ncbi:MAG: DUF4105 domain-containing protein [Muribaculaceae bacterium]|nr:DUF4105 domain-containing protein [Muribaculaceae bacterium]